MTIKNITPNTKIATLPEPMPNRVGQAYTGEIMSPFIGNGNTQELRYTVDNDGIVSICNTSIYLPPNESISQLDVVAKFDGGFRALNYSIIPFFGSLDGASRDFIAFMRLDSNLQLVFHSMIGQSATLSQTAQWYNSFTNNTSYNLAFWTAGTCFSTASREFSGRW